VAVKLFCRHLYVSFPNWFDGLIWLWRLPFTNSAFQYSFSFNFSSVSYQTYHWLHLCWYCDGILLELKQYPESCVKWYHKYWSSHLAEKLNHFQLLLIGIHAYINTLLHKSVADNLVGHEVVIWSWQSLYAAGIEKHSHYTNLTFHLLVDIN
jgi:hypothetical protein